MSTPIKIEVDSQIERVILLGFFPLVAATTSGWLALGAGIVILTILGAVQGIVLVTQKLEPSFRWALLLVISFSLSWLLSQVLPFILPVSQGSAMILLISGITPLVFRPGTKEFNVKSGLTDGLVFFGLLIFLGVVREYLGRGSMFGLLVPPYYVTPMGLFNQPIGGFTLLGTLVLFSRIAQYLQAKKKALPTEQKTQEVHS